MRHQERHRAEHIGWLRAAVLGANDGLISTASLVLGVAASGASRSSVLVSGVAGIVAGAMSMAAGEYVSVSSQADTEAADLSRERQELISDPEAELRELARIYEGRGLTPDLAGAVAEQLTANDALAAHLRDELSHSELTAARPIQAAFASASTFAVGAIPPVMIAALAPRTMLAGIVTASTLVLLALLGSLAARVGGAAMWRGAARVAFWGRWPWGYRRWWGGSLEPLFS